MSGNGPLPGVIEKTWDKASSDKMNRTLCEFMTERIESSGTDLPDFYILQVYF